jgi:hypothetical protein
VAHAPAPQRFERSQRHRRIRIRCDHAFNERCRFRECHPARVGRDGLSDRRPHASRRVFRQLHFQEGIGGGQPDQQSRKRLTQHFFGDREKPLLLDRRRANVLGHGRTPIGREPRQHSLRQDDGVGRDDTGLGRGSPVSLRENQGSCKNDSCEAQHRASSGKQFHCKTITPIV